jgi:hypothetical protein
MDQRMASLWAMLMERHWVVPMECWKVDTMAVQLVHYSVAQRVYTPEFAVFYYHEVW